MAFTLGKQRIAGSITVSNSFISRRLLGDAVLSGLPATQLLFARINYRLALASLALEFLLTLLALTGAVLGQLGGHRQRHPHHLPKRSADFLLMAGICLTHNRFPLLGCNGSLAIKARRAAQVEPARIASGRSAWR